MAPSVADPRSLGPGPWALGSPSDEVHLKSVPLGRREVIVKVVDFEAGGLPEPHLLKSRCNALMSFTLGLVTTDHGMFRLWRAHRVR